MSLRWSAQLAATPTPGHAPTPHAVSASTIIRIVHSGGGGGDAAWNLAAAWVTAGATVGLFLFAIVTARYAAKAFRKQSEDVALTREDVALAREQADRDIRERRRAQAAQVFIVISPPQSVNVPSDEGGIDRVIRVTATGTNTSTRPIYDIEVQWRTASGPFGDTAMEPQILPGLGEQFLQRWTAEQGVSGLAVSLSFRDAAGVQWRTNDRGELAELCGQLGPFRQRCAYEPGYNGPHFWEQAPSPAQTGTGPRIPQLPGP